MHVPHFDRAVPRSGNNRPDVESHGSNIIVVPCQSFLAFSGMHVPHLVSRVGDGRRAVTQQEELLIQNAHK